MAGMACCCMGVGAENPIASSAWFTCSSKLKSENVIIIVIKIPKIQKFYTYANSVNIFKILILD